MLRVLSIFAGIGGFDLGLERTGGFTTVAFAEVDPYASKVLALRFPDVPNLGDVTTAEYPDADIICAGFPCQDISYAGEGAGLAGERSGLFREVVRAVRMVRPSIVILENVAALLSRGLDIVLGELASLGYDAEWHCIPASAVGAPHRRDRIWIVADAGSDEHEGCRTPLSGTFAKELSRASADATTMLGAALVGNEPDGDFAGSEALADAASERQSGPRQPVERCDPETHGERQAVDAEPSRLGSIWSAEPNVGRVANGVPSRVGGLCLLHTHANSIADQPDGVPQGNEAVFHAADGERVVRV